MASTMPARFFATSRSSPSRTGLTIVRDVEQGLEDALSGRESERLVQRRVDEILDDELGEDRID